LDRKYPALDAKYNSHKVDGEREISLYCRVDQSLEDGDPVDDALHDLHIHYLDNELQQMVLQEKASLVDKSNF
jgi:hypothetical protein